ncbi:MAG: APC family permease [Pseudomonadota bacterium]
MSRTAFKSLFRKKDLNQVIKEAHDPNVAEDHHGLKRSLTATNLVMLGVGGIVGAGIFSLTGAAAANYAGPAIVFSFVIGGILCALAGVCYAEMAAMVPVSGSAYAYSYATMGEIIAWIIGWDLVLEYAFGAVTVSASWSGYVYSLLHKTLGINFPDWVIRLTKGPWEQVILNDGSSVFGIWNLPASLVSILVMGILVRGIHESAFINNIIVVIKVSIVLSFIALGWAVIDHMNWIADPSASGFMQLVPKATELVRDGRNMMAYGLPGVLTGAGVVFFAYIGFDSISTTAQECKNPQRDLPIGILGSLIICTLLYILMALVLTGVVPYAQLGVPDPVAVGIDRIVSLRGWSVEAQKLFTFLVKVGAISGLTSVILVLMMGQTRIFYSMSHDGLLPWFYKVHRKYGSPHVATIVTGIFCALCGGLMPMSLVGELVSIGTLLAFVLVCIGVPILRVTHPNAHRPFKVIGAWPVGISGAAACLWVMYGLPADTWIRLLVWLMIGFVIYFAYGRKHSKLKS